MKETLLLKILNIFVVLRLFLTSPNLTKFFFSQKYYTCIEDIMLYYLYNDWQNGKYLNSITANAMLLVKIFLFFTSSTIIPTLRRKRNDTAYNWCRYPLPECTGKYINIYYCWIFICSYSNKLRIGIIMYLYVIVSITNLVVTQILLSRKRLSTKFVFFFISKYFFSINKLLKFNYLRKFLCFRNYKGIVLRLQVNKCYTFSQSMLNNIYIGNTN